MCSKLQPVLGIDTYVARKPISTQQWIAMALWIHVVEYRSITHHFGVGLSSVCAIGHDVCEAIVTTLGHRYIRIPQGNGMQPNCGWLPEQMPIGPWSHVLFLCSAHSCQRSASVSTNHCRWISLAIQPFSVHTRWLFSMKITTIITVLAK